MFRTTTNKSDASWRAAENRGASRSSHIGLNQVDTIPSFFRRTRRSLEQLGHKLTELRRPSHTHTFPTARYFEQFDSSNPESRQAILELFSIELRSWLDEWVLSAAEIRYQKYGAHGINNAAPYKTTQLTQEYLEQSAQLGKSINRPQVDHYCAQVYESFLADPSIKLGQQLFHISYRDDPDHYHGKHKVGGRTYAQITLRRKAESNALHPVDDEESAGATNYGQVEFIQRRSFDSPQQLAAFFAYVSQFGTAYAPPQLSTPPAACFEQEHTLKHLVVSPEFSLSDPAVEAVMYQHSSEWYITPEEHPQIDAAVYYDLLQTVLAVCEGLFIRLAANDSESGHEQLDVFINTYLKALLKKKIEQLASNIATSDDELEIIVSADTLLPLFEAVEHNNRSTLSQALQASRLSSPQMLKLNRLNFCMPLPNMQTLQQTLSLDMTAINQFSSLPQKLQREILTNPHQYGYHLVDLKHLGARERYLVPLSYFEDPLNPDASSWKVVSGEVLGPCNIPLSQDPLVTVVDANHGYEQDNQEAMTQLDGLPHEVRGFAHGLLRLFSPPTISLTGLINGRTPLKGSRRLKDDVRHEAEQHASPLRYLAKRISELLNAGAAPAAVLSALVNQPAEIAHQLNVSQTLIQAD